MTQPTCNPVVSCQWIRLPGGQQHPQPRLVPCAKLPKRLIAAISIILARFVFASILLESPALQGVTKKIRTHSQWRQIGYVSSVVCIQGFAICEFPSRATDRPPIHVAMGTAYVPCDTKTCLKTLCALCNNFCFVDEKNFRKIVTAAMQYSYLFYNMILTSRHGFRDQIDLKALWLG